MTMLPPYHRANISPNRWGAHVAMIAVALVSAKPVSAQTTNYCQTNYCQSYNCSGMTHTGPDFHGKTLTNVNFRGNPVDYLKNANFAGATLIGVNFADMDLTGADFSNAVFQSNDQGVRTSLVSATLQGTCFAGAQMAGANLQYATLNATDFSCAALNQTQFGPVLNFATQQTGRSHFDYATVGIATSDSYLFPLQVMGKTGSYFWGNTAFTCTRFLGITNQSFTPAEMSLTGAILRGVVLDGFDFSSVAATPGSCSHQNADFTGSNLANTNFSTCDLDGAIFTSTNLSGANFTSASLYTKTAADFTSANLSNALLNQGSFQQARFSGATMARTQGLGANFNQAVFQATESLGATAISSANLKYATFRNAALNGVNFSNTILDGTDFSSTTLSQTNFLNSTSLIGATFESSSLQGVSFGIGGQLGAALNNASFKSATLKATPGGSGVSFLCANLGGADFSSSALSKVNFSNAVFPPSAQCCAQTGGATFCGFAANGVAYGPTQPPAIAQQSGSVICPDGASCDGSNWSLDTWQTIACSATAQPVTLWKKPNCSDTPAQPVVTVKDHGLKACLQDLLFNGADMPITVKAAATLQFLDCPNRKIADISALAKSNFPNLLTVDLSANALSGPLDLSGLSESLQSVKLSYNQITTLTFGEKQAALVNITASNNNLTAVNLNANTYPVHVDLSYNNLTGDLKQFTQASSGVAATIDYLDLSFNQLTDVGDVGNLTSAATIYLQSNKLTTVGSVSGIWSSGQGKLYNFSVAENACFQCSSLGVDRATEHSFGCACNPNVCPSCSSGNQP